MKCVFAGIVVLLCMVSSHAVAGRSMSENDACSLDSVPKVEINGRLKVATIPEGAGMQVVTDANGNLYKSSLFLPPGGGHDSLTYTVITGYGPVFGPGTYPLQSFSAGGTPEDFTGFGVPCTLSKKRDMLTIGFTYLLALHPSNSIEIEIKVYEAGATTPYLSYKLKNITVLSFSSGTSYGETGVLESYTLVGQVFGLKNVETGGSFAFSSVSDTEVPY